jgi:cytochrome c oxidase assembly protein subunit 15
VASFFWPRCEPSAKWLRTLGVIAFVAVVVQGVLGGLRVIETQAQLGIFHATLAQLFLLLVCAIALFQTDFWRSLRIQQVTDESGLRVILVITTALVLGQLMLGATMRHQHAGLAIPDFPAAYGKIWPRTDAASVAAYNQARLEVGGENPITATQIVLQMVHRMIALALVLMVSLCAWKTARVLGFRHLIARAAQGWLALVCVQICLGAATIWTGKSADIATAHVACGAACLVTGGLTSLLAFRILAAPALQKNASNQGQASAFAATPQGVATDHS